MPNQYSAMGPRPSPGAHTAGLGAPPWQSRHKAAVERTRELKHEEREQLKVLHYMKCPKCGMDLHTIERGHVQIDTCFNCHGLWLDAGELEQVRQRLASSGYSLQSEPSLSAMAEQRDERMACVRGLADHLGRPTTVLVRQS